MERIDPPVPPVPLVLGQRCVREQFARRPIQLELGRDVRPERPVVVVAGRDPDPFLVRTRQIERQVTLGLCRRSRGGIGGITRLRSQPS